MLGHNDFKAKDSWLSQQECKFGIKFKKAHSDKGSSDAVSAEHGTPQSCQTCFRNFALMSIMLMEQAYFSVPRQMVP